jgi:uncharacterized Tic20 family protein
MIQALDQKGMEQTSTSEERTMALVSHLGGYFTWIVVPLVLWLQQKDQSQFVAHHAREALNFQITQSIYILIVTLGCAFLYIVVAVVTDPQAAFYLALTVYILVGSLFAILELVGIILASMAAWQGKNFRYFLCIRGV